LLVGIDLGTSAVKAAVTTTDGEELGHGASTLEWIPVATGAETTLTVVRRHALAAVTDALARAPAGRVLGVGVTGMAEAGVLLDHEERPVAPIIVWHDTRGRREAEQLEAALGTGRFSATTGLPVSATPTIMKLAWLKRHGDAVARAHRWLGVPEALVHSLGAAPVADLSLACRTGFLDLERRSWWQEAIDWLDAPDLLLGELVPSGTRLGTVDGDAPARLKGAVLTVAGHDHLTAAFGAGAIGEGDVFDSCGTAEALLWATRPLGHGTLARAVADGLSVSWHVLPGMQALIASAPTGLFLNSVLERLGCTAAEARDALDQAAARLSDPPGPRLDELSADALIGAAGNRRSPEQVWRVAVDAATAELADVLTVVAQYGGTFGRLIATGGWTRSQLVLAAKRRRFGAIALPQVTQAGARGAALMAGVAGGLYGGPLDAPLPRLTSLTTAAAPGSHLTLPRHQPHICVPGPKESSL